MKSRNRNKEDRIVILGFCVFVLVKKIIADLCDDEIPSDKYIQFQIFDEKNFTVAPDPDIVAFTFTIKIELKINSLLFTSTFLNPNFSFRNNRDKKKF
jgi:hypothetical protein